MLSLSERLKHRYFGRCSHPYTVLRRRIEDLLAPDATVLDAGCGRRAPTLTHFRGRARRLIGVDQVAFAGAPNDLELRQRDLADTGVAADSVNLMYSQAVLEHVTNPDAVFAEIARLLTPGGRYIGLTANKWDYASLAARIVPNRFHPWIVRRTEGRAEEDVFPTVYRVNTWRDVARFATRHGLELAEFRYLGQYPSYFMFNGALFLIATAYHKLLESVAPLRCLQGWLLLLLSKTA
ncbi:MAG: class I SAM-dependent methyltransferase, partial [Stellaceae bacterium]